MWGYSSCDSTFTTCTAPSSPGPEITVPAGDSSLIVHLQNTLPENTSIMIPGQTKPMVPQLVGGRVHAFDAEAAVGGGTQNYTWIDLRPGTYMYQSGSHVQLQVQMGLYGSMTHDAASGQAYAGVAYDQAKTVVFSEIDPLLHGSGGGLVTSPILATSFESPIVASGSEATTADNWTVTGRAGVFYPAGASILVPTNGSQVGWSYAQGQLSQVTGEPLTADTTYQLDVDVGDRTDTPFAGYTVGLYANNGLLAQDSALTPNAGFLKSTITFTAPAGHSALGQPLEIRLASTQPALPVTTPITVNNPSFEAPNVANGAEGNTATGWVVTVGAGVFDPASNAILQPTLGSQAGWGSGVGRLSQVTGETVAANATYALEVDVGDRSDVDFAGYTVGLYANGTPLQADTNSLSPNSGFLKSTISFTVPTGHPAVGQRLEVRLAGTDVSPPVPVQIAVLNASFESPDCVLNGTNTTACSATTGGRAANNATSWSQGGGENASRAGVFDPADTALSPPDSDQAGWSYNQRQLRQQLPTTENLKPSTTYTLSVKVGKRTGTPFAGYSVGLYDGDVPLARDINTLTILDGTFTTSTVSFTTPANQPSGRRLQIRLASTIVGTTNTTNRTYFDDVRLERVSTVQRRSYFDNIILRKTMEDTARTVFDQVTLVKTTTTPGTTGKAANATVDGYLPRYFLINGSGTPTDLVTATAGQRVLLRLVNAGLQNRAPQLVGGYFEIVGEDGHRTPVSHQQYNTLLPAGKSLDVIFEVPADAAPGTVYTLYDRRLGLSNGSGQLGHIVVSGP
ncbi:MAG: multicopper oxidase domain-containing protein [Gammaproteobacteria bacterium]|nr:multicopper oxidase domain-containing protein [Gammaproteobacteria bacterium]